MNFTPLQNGIILPEFYKKKKKGNGLIIAVITCSIVSPADGKGNQGDGNPHT